ncbi:hypothetical protein [Rhodococcus koreensis]|uniref:hypothetical protein n=1 Tax=Rhodococcus koreensis TaxID=99653 RepID=UPI003670137F
MRTQQATLRLGPAGALAFRAIKLELESPLQELDSAQLRCWCTPVASRFRVDHRADLRRAPPHRMSFRQKGANCRRQLSEEVAARIAGAVAASRSEAPGGRTRRRGGSSNGGARHTALALHPVTVAAYLVDTAAAYGMGGERAYALSLGPVGGGDSHPHHWSLRSGSTRPL